MRVSYFIVFTLLFLSALVYGQSYFEEFKQVSTGFYHSLLLTQDGVVYSWGIGTFGELGIGSTSVQRTPEKIPQTSFNGEKVEYIDAGIRNSVCITASKKVYVWGHNAKGALGLGDQNNRITPQLLNMNFFSGTITSISINTHTVAVTSNGKVYTWGDSTDGKLGPITPGNTLFPKLVPQSAFNGEEVIKAVAVERNTFLVTRSGSLVRFGGRSASDQLHVYNSSHFNNELVVDVTSSQQQNIASLPSVIVKTNTGKLFSFGRNNNGVLLTGDTTDRTDPTAVDMSQFPNEIISSVAVGDGLVLLLSNSGNVYSPSMVAKMHFNNEDVVQISNKFQHRMALTSLKKVYVWGENSNGMLGLGDSIDRDNPTLLPLCKAGYEGAQCDIALCYGKRSNLYNVCNGRGNCTAPDTCTCENGVVGNECDKWFCSGKAESDKSVCSGNGICTKPDTCICNQGYYGENCENYDCFGYNKTSPTGCNGRGSCAEPDKCQCIAGSRGSRCEEFTCFGYSPSSTYACGNGKCIDVDTCRCNPGYHGEKCNLFRCNGKLSNDQNACSSHGTCRISGCSCDTGYFGSDCQNFTCSGINSMAYDVCNGRGVCKGYNFCECKPGYTGQYCQYASCFGFSGSSSNSGCNSNGNCIDTDTCNCNSGYYGEKCGVYLCNGKLSNDSNVCSSHGTCGRYGCSCNNGYYGSNCESTQCYGILSSNPRVCGGHGECNSEGKCLCKSGYSGRDCTDYSCFGKKSSEYGVCSRTGSCIGIDTCSCNPGYYGEKCDMFLCNGKLSNDSNVCSSHGTCGRYGCSCNNGYYGSDCEFTRCYGILSSNPRVCGGHGECNSEGKCLCKSGYSGRDCTDFSCFGKGSSDFDVCSRSGSCIEIDKCSCTSGIGKECEIPLCYGKAANDTKACGGKGTCSSSGCSCKEGTIGDECQFVPIKGANVFGKIGSKYVLKKKYSYGVPHNSIYRVIRGEAPINNNLRTTVLHYYSNKPNNVTYYHLEHTATEVYLYKKVIDDKQLGVPKETEIIYNPAVLVLDLSWERNIPRRFEHEEKTKVTIAGDSRDQTYSNRRYDYVHGYPPRIEVQGINVTNALAVSNEAFGRYEDILFITEDGNDLLGTRPRYAYFQDSFEMEYETTDLKLILRNEGSNPTMNYAYPFIVLILVCFLF